MIGSNCGLGQPYNRLYNDSRDLMTTLVVNFPVFTTSADSFLNDTTFKTGLLNMVEHNIANI
jgi:hypothetical protein